MSDTTISLVEQLRASRAIYEAALADIRRCAAIAA